MRGRNYPRRGAGVALALVPVSVALIAAALAATASAASVLCVGAGQGCYSTIQLAVDAAQSGDTVKVGKGTFVGAVRIEKDLRLVGSGAKSTVIRGGGPVVTIGVDGAADPPTVSLTGVTITGGVNTSVPSPSVTLGGGIWIPAGTDGAPGADVSIVDSAIVGNVARPEGTGDCGFPCSFALGGGIYNSGHLTLSKSLVANNVAGTSASHTFGGGILNDSMATLDVDGVIVSGNHSAATGANGRVAEGGGLMDWGTMNIRRSTVSDNVSEQSSTLTVAPEDDHVANSGGIDVHGTATITDTVVRGNRVLATNTSRDGFTNAFGGGLVIKGPVTLERSIVTDNLVRVRSAGDAEADAGGVSVDLTVATIRDTVISGNRAIAEGEHGAVASAGGVFTLGVLTVERTVVRNNVARATGGSAPMPWGELSGAKGGGMVNAVDPDGDPPQLTLRNSSIVGNSVSGSRGYLLAGGGVFTSVPIAKSGTLISGNTPDQCAGGGC